VSGVSRVTCYIYWR